MLWDGFLNARDLGGLPLPDGRETRWRSIVRSESPARLTEVGRSALVEYGVRSIVDLRLPEELVTEPNPFAEPGEHGITYHHRSFLDPAAGPAPEFTTLAEDYKRMLERFRTQVGAIMATIASAPEGAVLIHCAVGKDRTGLTSALLLELAGVSRDAVVADYALTAEFLRPRDLEWLETGPGDRAWRENELTRFRAREEVMLDVLEHVEERHGSAAGYLRWTGLSDADIARLRRRLA